MGYGSRAIEAITSFYSGELFNLDDVPADLGESFEEAAHGGPVCPPSRNEKPVDTQ